MIIGEKKGRNKNMGRRKRKVVRLPRKKLPKIFMCPKCGINAVHVASTDVGQALVKCGNCGLAVEVPISPTDQPVDLYCKFSDKFYERAS